DYLMPAEFFPVALVGAGLLLWAALWVHSRRALIGWGSGAMIAFLAGGQALVVATGIASGRIKPVGLVFGLVVASLVLYCLALIEVGVTGILLWQDIFRGGKKEGAHNA
ncbi:MAG TPA: hypothetical protein VHY08_21900, partial [Bacillota bacterium]|nr:hypothetical protein [Bacillota bacterium]